MSNPCRDRGYYRQERENHINRKKKIIHDQQDYWHYKSEGELSKGKIHCSCGMCRRKTNNKGHISLERNKNWKHSDLVKMERTNYIEIEE